MPPLPIVVPFAKPKTVWLPLLLIEVLFAVPPLYTH
jgi:hypothetical protein